MSAQKDSNPTELLNLLLSKTKYGRDVVLSGWYSA